MADNQDMLFFLDFLDGSFDRSERVVLPRGNPYDDYDENKFRERFRLSKRVALHLLTEVGLLFYSELYRYHSWNQANRQPMYYRKLQAVTYLLPCRH